MTDITTYTFGNAEIRVLQDENQRSDLDLGQFAMLDEP